jgi:hypothetical protein
VKGLTIAVANSEEEAMNLFFEGETNRGVNGYWNLCVRVCSSLLNGCAGFLVFLHVPCACCVFVCVSPLQLFGCVPMQ